MLNYGAMLLPQLEFMGIIDEHSLERDLAILQHTTPEDISNPHIIRSKLFNKNLLSKDINKQVIIDLGSCLFDYDSENSKLEARVEGDTIIIKQYPLKIISMPFKNCFIQFSINRGDNHVISAIEIIDNENGTYNGSMFIVNNGYTVAHYTFEIIPFADYWEIQGKLLLQERPLGNISNVNSLFMSACLTNEHSWRTRENFLQYVGNTFGGMKHALHFLSNPKNKCFYKVSGKSKSRAKYKNNSSLLKTPIYIFTDKANEKTITSSYNGQQIERLTSWMVRGHWRHIDERKYGKNQQGEYKIKGLTWVVPYKKGNYDIEPNKRTYVYLDKKEREHAKM